ncbi:MAG TPA: amino acid permease [Acidimicrobiales bacterium]|nr:amino acid permease [Acidimicrobiales bacterium]
MAIRAIPTARETPASPAPGPVPELEQSGVPLPPDALSYRLKRRLLGEPLHSDELEHQRLGKPTALAVFASDNLSSSAYATEEILHVLIPVAGVVAFSLVFPITVAMCVVLGFLILSYRETIKEYPSAGGAYLVTKDNFGPTVAQVAGASLLTDYVLTVSVSASAGTAALTSAFHALEPYRVPIALFFIALIAFGNLRGVKESGRIFAIPTYFFMVNMALLLGIGAWKYLAGDLPTFDGTVEGQLHWGAASGVGFLLGVRLFDVLHAFASGGAAVTGVEAISNGVPAFHEPAWRNARQTLVIMGTGLGVMFLGVSALAAVIHVTPFESGSPTVIAQIGDAVFGGGVAGDVLFYSLQAGTMLILVMAANTGFADFPRLASFQAGDSFLPRQLTKRGHRLVYSNGIIALATAAGVLVVVTGAEVTRLIPLYAIGVFTGFTLSQAGMTKHHLRKREPGWRRGVVINGFGAMLSAVVALIIAVTKFVDGAWAVLIILPLLVLVFLRLNRQYVSEAEHLEVDVPEAATAPILRRHVVLVLVDRLDLAVGRAIQYARTLTPDEMRAVHFIVDDEAARHLADEWGRLGLHRIPLELVECPDRRIARAAVETVARELADGDTEVSVLLPDRKYRGLWHRVLHDRTAEQIQEEMSRLPHANVTTVPFIFDSIDHARVPLSAIIGARGAPAVTGPREAGGGEASFGSMATVRSDGNGGSGGPPAGCLPIAEARYRDRVRLGGRVRSLMVAPQHDAPVLELVLDDGTAGISVVFLGRRRIPGVDVGTRMVIEGTVGLHRNRLAVLNPTYELRL